ncbi:hypothetical protein AB0E69_07030 [Kribbella sp. NPDC026611]|uniref:hypothetical protein n=1 Tax=Kribbella sp. NPDC026611 TaxID=3154911 RepID=UPI0033D132E7
MEKLSETLDAALVDAAAAQLLRSGQLTSALRHVGFGVLNEDDELAQLAPARPRVVRHTEAAKPARQRTEAAEAASRPTGGAVQSAGRQPGLDRTLDQRRAALRRRVNEAESDYAAASADLEEAERALDAHQHRIADLEADLVRLNEQLEETRQALRDARKQTPGSSATSTRSHGTPGGSRYELKWDGFLH